MKRVFLALAFMLAFSLFGYSQNEEYNRQITKFGQLLFYLNNYYIDSVNNEKLTEEAIKKALSQLDPHSSYITAKDVRAMNEPLEGNFEGIGVEFAIINDTLTVSSPILGGPSERVGIRAGDKIIGVDGENITSIGITNEMVFKYLRGQKGSKVNLSIVRRGVEGTLLFEVIRDRIPINSVDAAYMPTPGVVYIKLSRFASNSAQEIIESLIALNPGHISGFILDLRGNSGGFLGTAMEISNFFLESGQTIVYTEGLKVPKMTERAKGTGFYRRGALAVLIDENSASASEIVAGAVQDWDRGAVIGRRSFGKGLVQQMLPLNDGSQLRLTVARYHTPSGRVIQSPYEAGAAEKYYKAFIERYERGESFNRDSIHFPDSLKYRTLKKGRVVYGGGGIMPDIFIPADTSHYTKFYSNLLRRGVVGEFVNGYIDRNRSQLLAKYIGFDSFNKDFQVDEALMQSLLEFALKKGVEHSKDELIRSANEISVYMKALIARSLYGNTAYFRIINNNNDTAFNKAMDFINGKLEI